MFFCRKIQPDFQPAILVLYTLESQISCSFPVCLSLKNYKATAKMKTRPTTLRNLAFPKAGLVVHPHLTAGADQIPELHVLMKMAQIHGVRATFFRVPCLDIYIYNLYNIFKKILYIIYVWGPCMLFLLRRLSESGMQSKRRHRLQANEVPIFASDHAKLALQ